MLAIGNDELKDAQDVESKIVCPLCGKNHFTKYGEIVLKDGTKKPSKILAFYNCKGKSYLCGINGKRI